MQGNLFHCITLFVFEIKVARTKINNRHFSDFSLRSFEKLSVRTSIGIVMPRFMITRKFKRWAEPNFVSGVPWFKTKSQLHVSNIFHQLPHKHSSTTAATPQGISHSVPHFSENYNAVFTFHTAKKLV